MGKPLTRLFFQDHSAAALKWADVLLDKDGRPTLGPIADIAGFPKLEPSRQKLVQMRESQGVLFVGVRDDDGGKFQSGWILATTGVSYLDHGDHGHWQYKRKPTVWDSRLDTEQGNPAHLYVYDGCFFLANDQLNGYTRIDPRKYIRGKDGKLAKDGPRFLVGGGNHITLAVVDDKVGYSCWIDGGGPNKGRVDVTPVTDSARSEPAYSFFLPTGGIHGAIANQGKVFFAPADGVCWTTADPELRLKPDQVKVHHIPLGKSGDRPLRTGAFVNHERYVVFVTGKEKDAALVLLDAAAPEPKPIRVPLNARQGAKPTTPRVAVTPAGKALAFVFHDHDRDDEGDDFLTVIDLDPNGDGDCADATIVKELKVGASAVEGHFGHHAIDFDAERRFGFFTNPGDGTISVLTLPKLEMVATFPVGGLPTALVAHGGRYTED
jgi:hypothetical protein